MTSGGCYHTGNKEIYGARPQTPLKGPVYGWCSWYDRTTKIDDVYVMDVVDTIEANPNTVGKDIVQIDDGYQIMDGNWIGYAKDNYTAKELNKNTSALLRFTPITGNAPILVGSNLRYCRTCK